MNTGAWAGRWFLRSAGLALAVTGFAKALSALGSARVLDVLDPIAGIPFRYLMLLVGVAELLIALVCFVESLRHLCLVSVAWLSTCFLVYRIGLWWIDWQQPCRCLGRLTDVLHISPTTADNLMKGLLIYLLLGSYGLLWRCYRSSETPALPDGTSSAGGGPGAPRS